MLHNTSAWPTPAVSVILGLILRREGIDPDAEHAAPRPLTVHLMHARRHRLGGCTNAAARAVRAWVHRRFTPVGGFPYAMTDPRLPADPPIRLRSRLEALAFVLGHEIHHTTGGHPERHGLQARRRPGRLRPGERRNARGEILPPAGPACARVAAMERACNAAGMAAVELLRAEWPAVRAELFRAMRAAYYGAERRRVRTRRRRGMVVLGYVVGRAAAMRAAAQCRAFARVRPGVYVLGGGVYVLRCGGYASGDVLRARSIVRHHERATDGRAAWGKVKARRLANR